MAIISIPRKELEKLAKYDDALVEKINLFGTPVESFNHDNIEVEVLPNRPDMFSSQGFLRSFRTYLGLKKINYEIKKPESNYKVKIDNNLKNIRPFTSCAIVKNLKLDDERIKQIIDLQEKLHSTIGRDRKKMAIGIYPLEKIKLPITFEARNPKDINFIPLEENKSMNGLEILEKNSTGKEYAHLLKGLDKFPVFVDANKKILSMPPIINSDETGRVTKETKDVFVECSGFDFELLKKTLNIIITTLADMNGVVYQMELDYGKKELTPDLKLQEINISLHNINKLIGLNLNEKEIESLLLKMGYEYRKNKAFAPAWRTDILHEVDVIEDIAIAYGYDNLVPEIPEVSTIGEENREEKIKSKIVENLIGLGLIEVLSYHLIKEEESKMLKLDHEAIELLDSKTEYKLLRPNLLISGLRILFENKHNEYPQNIFEIGTVFRKGDTETGVIENTNLSVVLCDAKSNFTQVMQILDSLLTSLGISYSIKEDEDDNFISGRFGKIIVNDKEIAKIGELHPRILKNFNLELPVSCLELNLDEIFKIL